MVDDSVEIPINSIADPDIGSFVAYWHSLRGNRFAPSWTEFDLLSLNVKSIPKIVVVDVLYDPLRFKFRYWGTAHATTKGMELTGKFLTDAPSLRGTASLGEYTAVALEKRLVAARGTIHFPNVRRLPFVQTIVRLPLSEDGVVVDKIISLAHWQ